MSKQNRTSKGTWKPGVSGNPSGVSRGYGDGWGSLWTGIGSSTHDKRMSHSLIPPCLSYQQLIDLSESDDIGERAVKMPVDAAFSKGYEISITEEGEFDDLKADIEKRLRQLKVNQVIKKALYQKRGLGGSAILLGVEDFRPLSSPINQDALRGLNFLTVLEPQMLQPYEWYTDPTAEKFGDVKIWQVLATTQSSMGAPDAVKVASNKQQAAVTYLVHESRLIMLVPEKISAYSTTKNPAGDYWGQSIIVKLYEVLRDFHVSWAAAGLIITDFSQGVFSVENLMQLIMRDEEKLIERMRALETGRSVARSIVIDKEHEAFERKSTNVSGLPDMLVQISRRMAAAIDIPLKLLMAGGTKSEDAEVGDELRFYYDKCESVRMDDVEPILRLIIEIIIRGLRKYKVPKHWSIKWPPLWQLTDEQKANARLAQARVDMIYIQGGVLDPQTVALARFGGEYSFETPIGKGYKAPGFMALPPVGVLVDGLDPNTGLPPGVEPPKPDGTPGGPSRTSSVSVAPHARNKPRRTNAAKMPDVTSGGAKAPGASLKRGDDEHCDEPHEMHEIQECEHCATCDECLMAKAVP